MKHLVAAQNGVMRVESVVRQGSTFYSTLPVEEKELPNAEARRKR